LTFRKWSSEVEAVGLGLDGRALRVLGVLASVCLWLALVGVASADAESFTWSGGSSGRTESAAYWQNLTNWEGGEAPEASQTVATLTFPHLTSGGCTAEPPSDTCYLTLNDIRGLSAESMQLDDADDYLLDGEALTLGGGGLKAAPAGGASGEGGAFMLMPLALDAPQRWSIADRSGGELEENGLLLGSEVTGAGDPLTVELSNGPALILANETEVGPLTIEGADATGEHIDNGVVYFEGGALNSSTGQPVTLSNVFFQGTGAVGPLTLNNSTLIIGTGAEAAGGLETASARLDSDSGMLFEITGGGTAQVGYSQLVSHGSVELGGAIAVEVAKPLLEESGRPVEGPCPVLTPGQKYTFVSTDGALSGAFGNAPEGGPEIAIRFAKGCEPSALSMRISYDHGGGTETVVGTVEARAVEAQEEAARERETREREAETKEHEATTQEEEANRKRAEEQAKKAGEEAALAAKGRGEEAALARKHEEESLARGGVLGIKEHSGPRSLTRAQLLAKGLKQCKKQPKQKRAKCAAAVRKKYGKKSRKK
jgi:hypothetical protein